MEEKKGSKLLKVTSILMIIGGIIGAVGSVIMALLAGASTALMNNAEYQTAMNEAGVTTGTATAALWIATIIAVVSAVIEIIAGTKGKKNWDKPEAAKTLMIWGIVCAVISLVGTIIGGNVQFLTIVTGIAIPVLYIIGAVQLKNQA